MLAGPLEEDLGSEYPFLARKVSNALACWSLAPIGVSNILSYAGYLPFCPTISLSSSQPRPTSSDSHASEHKSSAWRAKQTEAEHR